jgi:hypothetical protein
MLGFRELSFAVRRRSPESWRIRVSGELEVPDAVTGELILRTDNCPLELAAVRTSWSERVVQRDGGSSMSVVLPSLARTALARSSLTVTLEFEWTPSWSQAADKSTRDTHWVTPCLVLPDMLPQLGSSPGRGEHGVPTHLPRLFFAEELPRELSAGGVSIPDWRRRATPEFVQVVVYPVHPESLEYDDLGIAIPPTATEARSTEPAYEYLAPLRVFLGRELGLSSAVRPVAYLAPGPTDGLFPPTGAYCPLREDDAGMRRDGAGRPVAAIRGLSQAWLGAGMRIWGENSNELSLALGGALGLAWLEEQDEREHLERINDRRTDAGQPDVEDVESGSITAIARALEWPLYEGLRQARVRRALSKLVRKRWGSYVQQDELISLFRSLGVSVPGVFA